MKKNNKGLTLVELVVVIAIAAVMVATIGLGVNLVFSNKTKAASKTIYNMLGVAQNLGTSKENCYLALKSDGNDNVTAYVLSKKSDGNFVEVQKEEFSKVGISVVLKDGSTKDIGAGYGIMIAINRTTGGFDKAYNCTNVGWAAATSISACSDILIGGEYDIALSSTGKFYYKD